MSSIAYATDQEMMEYHRLCGNRNVNFWRLSSRAGFSDFQHGDLLFFYTSIGSGKRKKKGFAGYAHYEKTTRLSLKDMWKKYGTANGYDSIDRLKEAIELASRSGKVPEKLNCLYLSDCVYFRSPVLPGEVGIEINPKLESFTYLEKDDPGAAVRILRAAEERGIDLWASSQNYEPDTVFRLDEIREQLAFLNESAGKEERTAPELRRARKLAAQYVKEEGFEQIRGSAADLFKFLEEDIVLVAFPFAAQANDRALRVREMLGKMMYYRLSAEQMGLGKDALRFVVLCEETEEQKDLLHRAGRYV